MGSHFGSGGGGGGWGGGGPGGGSWSGGSYQQAWSPRPCPGNWTCPGCNSRNLESKEACWKCNKTSPINHSINGVRANDRDEARHRPLHRRGLPGIIHVGSM
eukprot:gene36036-65009_t